MHRVTYADTAFLTDSRIAEALFGYARVLAAVGQADVVSIPGVDADGVLRDFELIIGPASQMISHQVEDEPVAMDVESVAEDLAARTAKRLPQLDAGSFPDLGSERRTDGVSSDVRPG